MSTKVYNLCSPSSGKPVANQFEIIGEHFTIFQSYDSTIVKIINGKTYLDKHRWDYSRTTSKYRNEFLKENTSETQVKIDSGEYILKDLNN